MNPSGDRQYGMPLPGPIEELRLSAVTTVEATEMLRVALRHVGPTGAVDREAIAYLLDRDTRISTVVASLLRRAWAHGVTCGRDEALDEVPAIAAARRQLQDQADSVLALTERAAAALDEGADHRHILGGLIDDTHRTVEDYSAGGDRLTAAAARSVARYRAVIARSVNAEEDPYATRQLALVVAVETAAALHDSDAELAAAVRAVLAADQGEDRLAEDRLAAVVAACVEADQEPAPGVSGRNRGHCTGCTGEPGAPDDHDPADCDYRPDPYGDNAAADDDDQEDDQGDDLDEGEDVGTVYTGAVVDQGDDPDAGNTCSAHPIDGMVPLVDYGADRVATFRQVESDAAAARAALVDGAL
jgi:hypothetical protein